MSQFGHRPLFQELAIEVDLQDGVHILAVEGFPSGAQMARPIAAAAAGFVHVAKIPSVRVNEAQVPFTAVII